MNYFFLWYVCISFWNKVAARFCFCSSFWHIFIMTYFYFDIFIYFFLVVTFFDNFRFTLYFGTFELRMEITLQLRFVFARHCDVFFITSQLRYLFVRCSYVFWWRENYVIFWFVWITYGNNVTITFRFCWSLWRIFYYVTITLFICSL